MISILIGRPIWIEGLHSKSGGREGFNLNRPADSDSAKILNRAQHIQISIPSTAKIPYNVKIPSALKILIDFWPELSVYILNW